QPSLMMHERNARRTRPAGMKSITHMAVFLFLLIDLFAAGLRISSGPCSRRGRPYSSLQWKCELGFSSTPELLGFGYASAFPIKPRKAQGSTFVSLACSA